MGRGTYSDHGHDGEGEKKKRVTFNLDDNKIRIIENCLDNKIEQEQQQPDGPSGRYMTRSRKRNADSNGEMLDVEEWNEESTEVQRSRERSVSRRTEDGDE